jgi:hypothetical protein
MSMKLLLSHENRDSPGHRASKSPILKVQCSVDFSHISTNPTAHHEPLAYDHLLFGPQHPAWCSRSYVRRGESFLHGNHRRLWQLGPNYTLKHQAALISSIEHAWKPLLSVGRSDAANQFASQIKIGGTHTDYAQPRG